MARQGTAFLSLAKGDEGGGKERRSHVSHLAQGALKIPCRAVTSRAVSIPMTHSVAAVLVAPFIRCSTLLLRGSPFVYHDRNVGSKRALLVATGNGISRPINALLLASSLDG